VNYLILTPDGVGSTYLQRALTVYLNSAEVDYWNTHELLNGLGLSDGNLYKDFNLGYSQTLSEICGLLESTSNSLVSRIAQYHVIGRLEDKKENYQQLYNACNKKFDKIFYCTRDPFEYALSWSIRQKTKLPNVYSIKQRIEFHGEDKKQDIDLDFFIAKLNQYKDYDYWVSENFKNTQPVEYDTLHNDVDTVLQNLTGCTHNVEDRFGVSLQDYSRIRYLASKYIQTKDKQYLFDKTLANGTIDLFKFIRDLEGSKKAVGGIPVKMNTMQDKRSKVVNFEDAILTYNNWAKSSNQYHTTSNELIADRIYEENLTYAN